MSCIRLSACLSAVVGLFSVALARARHSSALTMVHLIQAIFEGGQVDGALLFGIQLLPQRPDPGIPLLSGLAIHSRVVAVLSWFHG